MTRTGLSVEGIRLQKQRNLAVNNKKDTVTKHDSKKETDNEQPGRGRTD